MKHIIPEPNDCFDALLSELEGLDQTEENDSQFLHFYDQFTSSLSSDHRSLIEKDRHNQAGARESGEKYYGSHLSSAVGLMVLQALFDPEKYESYKIPVAVADALIRLDNATPVDPVSVFECRSCGFFVHSVFLRDDAEKFSKQCPACGGSSD